MTPLTWREGVETLEFSKRIYARFSNSGTRRNWTMVKVDGNGDAYYAADDNAGEVRRTARVTSSGYAYGIEHKHIKPISGT